MKKSIAAAGAFVFFCFISAGEVGAQTISFEYEASRKYPIYLLFEGDVSAAAEMTAWFTDERSWHYRRDEWQWDDRAALWYYAGNDTNAAHWIVDNGVNFYIGPDDPNNAYAYLTNSAGDWELFRMALSNTNVIYASGNIAFDRTAGQPERNNPYVGQWRSREDDALAMAFNADGRCLIVKTPGKKPPPAKQTLPSGNNAVRNKLIAAGKTHLGSPYRLGATGPNRFDCSGFINVTYREAAGITIPRTSIEMYRQGKPISPAELQPGDIIVYATTGNKNAASHVSMYLGNNQVIHAIDRGNPNGVVLTPRDRSYWLRREIGYRRFLGN
jgi:cell wall-associated NlpC family hydrolase